VLRDNLLFKMSDDDWETVMNVHLKGAFLCSRAAQAHMVQQKYGRIISLSHSRRSPRWGIAARPTTPRPRRACKD
jgi:3-oxoacyl-[acyl-carrier protein] reductase